MPRCWAETSGEHLRLCGNPRPLDGARRRCVQRLDVRSKGQGGGIVEEEAIGVCTPESGLYPHRRLHHQERVPSQAEEVIVHADGVDPERRREDPAERRLDRDTSILEGRRFGHTVSWARLRRSSSNPGAGSQWYRPRWRLPSPITAHVNPPTISSTSRVESRTTICAAMQRCSPMRTARRPGSKAAPRRTAPGQTDRGRKTCRVLMTLAGGARGALPFGIRTVEDDVGGDGPVQGLGLIEAQRFEDDGLGQAQPAALREWWCPSGWTAGEIEVELRVGGAYRIAMARTAGGAPVVVSGQFLEVDPPKRLVYTWCWEGAFTDMPPTLVSLELQGSVDETLLTLRHENFVDAALRQQHRSGWISACDRLDRLVTPPAMLAAQPAAE